MKFSISILLSLLSLVTNAQQITIYDQIGNATHYLDQSTNKFFAFSGEPVAALVNEDIYNLKGEHIGWFHAGIIRDHAGNIPGFIKGSLLGPALKFEPYKNYQKYGSFLSPFGYPPAIPYFSSSFSKESIDAFFYKSPTQNAISSTNGSALTTNKEIYNTSKNFVSTPLYHPNFEALASTLEASQAVYDKTINSIPAGYIYDPAMNKYYSPKDWDAVKLARSAYLESIKQSLFKSKIFITGDKLKNGKYLVFWTVLGEEHPIIPNGIVKIKRNKLRSMVYTGRKRVFRNATKIKNGICTAKILDKFGFTQDSIEYPECIFYIFKLDK